METMHIGIKIAGIASTIPSNIISSTQSTLLSGDEIRKITDNLGFSQRRVVDENTCTSDLCFFAAEKLLQELDFSRDLIDGIIFVSQTPDHFIPATAFILHQRLNLPKTCFAFDVNLGCSGYVYGIWLASSLIQSGAKNVLLLAGDTISKLVSSDDRSTAFVFGDAGSATLISSDQSNSKIHTVIGSDGNGAKSLCVPDGAFRSKRFKTPIDSSDVQNELEKYNPYLFMDGSEVFAFTLREIPKMIKTLILRAETEISQVDGFFFHQANQFMLKHLAKRMGIPGDKVAIFLDGIGNTSSASIPVAITESRRQNPERIFGISVLAGFGVGWSWAGALLDLSGTVVMPTLEYPND
jgi:3-oxoacyl-[acyl-carrier-protein] synthase III